MDDVELVAACCRGDEDAWRSLIDNHAAVLSSAVRHCLRFFGQPVDAGTVEDLTEEVLLELIREDYKALRAFRAEASLRAYLFVFARRRCSHFVKRQRRRGAALAVRKSLGVTTSPKEATEKANKSKTVAAALGRLQPIERLLVRAHYFNGVSYRELAQLTGLSINSVGPALSRARAKLAHILRPK